MAIEIYTRDGCPACTTAKQLLIAHNKPYMEYKLDEDFTREILLSKFPEAKTFPVIVVDGFHIGGANQLKVRLDEEVNDKTKLLLEDTEYFGA